MESNREMEMGEIIFDVYDIFQPVPVSLRELSAIAISLEIWRCRANEYRNNRKLKEFCPSLERILLKKILPDLPTVICTAIDKYVRRFGPSMENWLEEHHNKIFYFYYDHQNFVLDYFDNFVCDYTGTMDYVRTARRMMHCARFDDNQKFMIACTYFFEDDIRRLWPLVSKNMDWNGINFSESPQLYYWICCLRNELDKIPCTEINNSIDKVMLDAFMLHNIPSIEYFWNRLPSENRIRRAFVIFARDNLSFTRFILPKLVDQQLEEFVNVRSYELIRSSFKNVWYDKELILPIWMCIKKIINVEGFTKVVVKMLESELLPWPGMTSEVGEDEDLQHRIWLDLCCEIWISAPENFKRSAVVEITSNKMLLDYWIVRFDLLSSVPSDPKEFKFLSTFFSDATSAERRKFWFDHWENLIEGLRCTDLENVMKLCFESNYEIAQFKENIMVNNEWVHAFCKVLLSSSYFDKFNDFSGFLWPDIQAARSFKQQMLRLAFLGRDNCFNEANILETKEFNKFIEDAFANIDLAADFKNQLASSLDVQRRLSQFPLSVRCEQVIEFIDTFVSAENLLLEIKARIIDGLKRYASYCSSLRCKFTYTPLLVWCLGSQEEVAKFKKIHL
ncbi:uncharacterized protein LOC135848568 [Planococcus citri]|uniref:uncharacterized protein LOC135848568 n=1 Tax=Planococcus citri TaxID=170843 RepID=UPI0031FA2871